jgi:hypothetical protein
MGESCKHNGAEGAGRDVIGGGGVMEGEHWLMDLPNPSRKDGILERKISRLLRGSRDFRIKSLSLCLVSRGIKSGAEAEGDRGDWKVDGWWVRGRSVWGGWC